MGSLVGAVPAVVIGGVGAIVCAGIWAPLFPALRNQDELITAKPARETST
jgi:hypothetical protein